MCSLIRTIFFSLFIFCSVTVAAQDDDFITDTIEAPSVTVNTTTSGFLPVSEVAQVPVRKVPGEKISELKKDDAYWYANLESERKKEEKLQESSGNSLFNKEWFQTLLWIIILVSFIAVVLWYLLSSNIQLFRKEPKKIFEEEEQDFTEDIFSVNYEREISRAAGDKNYRLAVRLWYLRTLKELAGRNIIEYRHARTNSDYLSCLSGGPYYKDFFRLTRNFEYTWYGQFPLSEEGYTMMQTDFMNFKNGLHS